MTKPIPSRLDQALADARADAEHKIAEAEAVIAAQRGIIAALDRVAAQAGEAAAQAPRPAQHRVVHGRVSTAILNEMRSSIDAVPQWKIEELVLRTRKLMPSIRHALDRLVRAGEVIRDRDLYRLREKEAAE